MAKPEKQWQLLLVADDGRVVPFKRIRGIALTLLVTLVLLGLICVGLVWQLGREKIKHRQTRGELASVRKEAARYKSENEIVTTELILAEARMEKAGLPVPKRQPDALPDQAAPTPVDAKPAVAETADESLQTPMENEAPADQLTATAPNDLESDRSPQKRPPGTEPPAISLGELELKHDDSKGRVEVNFRVSNAGSRSNPVEGWCLVALKNDPNDADTWLGLPDGAVANGKLDPKKGKNFRISRFVDMDVDAPLATNPSSFSIATVYIYDDAGTVLLEKDFPITLKSVPTDAEASVGGGAEELAITLSRFEVQYDRSANRLRTAFRVSNTGPGSSPASGRSVVVLKNTQTDPAAWVVLPEGALNNDKPDWKRGQPFRISRYKDMEIEVRTTTEPSTLVRAVVYIFGMDGDMLLEKTYPIRLTAAVP